MNIGFERLIALTGGIVALIVLEKMPPAADLAGLAEVWPTFLSALLSFVYVAIYWNHQRPMDKLD